MRSIKMFLTLIVSVTPLLYGAQPGAPVPAARPVPSLQKLALRALIPRPERTAQRYDEIYSSDAPDHPFESGVFAKSVGRALGRRLGLRALASKPDIPLKARMLGDVNEEFDAFSPDGKTIALKEMDDIHHLYYYIYLRNAETGELIKKIEGEGFRAFNPDNRLFASQAFTDGWDIHLRSTATGRLLRKIEGEEFRAFSPDGTLFASRNATAPHVVRLRSTATGGFVHVFKEGVFRAFSPDGKIIVLTVYDGETTSLETRLWSTATGKSLRGFEREVFHAFSRDGKIIALHNYHMGRGEKLILRKTETGELLPMPVKEEVKGLNPDGNVVALKVFDDIRLRYDIYVRNIATGAFIKKIEREEFLEFSPAGEKIVSNAWNHSDQTDNMQLRDMGTGKLCTFAGERFQRFSPDGKLLISTQKRPGSNVTRLRNVTGDLIREFEGEVLPHFSPDGTMLIVAGGRGFGNVVYEVDFSHDLANIKDFAQRVFLFNAAQDWLEGRPYRVDASNPVYQKIIEQIPYLNNPLLFDVGPTASSSSDGSSVIVGSSSGDNEEIQARDVPGTFIQRIMHWCRDAGARQQ